MIYDIVHILMQSVAAFAVAVATILFYFWRKRRFTMEVTTDFMRDENAER